MSIVGILRAKDVRGKNLRNRLLLLLIVTPVLAVSCVLIGLLISPAHPLFYILLGLSVVFVVIGVTYCAMEATSLRKFCKQCADAAFPCAVISEQRNIELFAADANLVREYAELELKLYAALYKEQGRRGARVVSDAERKRLKEQEKEMAKRIGRAYMYSEFGKEDALLLRNKTVFLSKGNYARCGKLVNWNAVKENGNEFVLLSDPKIAK